MIYPIVRKWAALAVCAAMLWSGYGAPAAAGEKQASLEKLSEGREVDGFKTLALYLNDADRPMGARFQHLRTGFTFDLLQIESVPQAFLWVNTPSTSDRGEPHTQEHLLLGKGNKGRYVASLEAMSLESSSAYTMQWRTCYFFNTVAGPEVFYHLLEKNVDALLHPDYTDEEVRREVRNFGVTADPDGELRLEEKGTVYNEMVSTSDKPYSPLFKTIAGDLYGSRHPLALVSGGTPEALRTLTPDEIRVFRNRDYYLGNMGMIGAFPRAMTLDSVLQKVGAILDRLQPGPSGADQPAVREPKFPAPQPAPPGTVQVVRYPDRNEQQPGTLLYAWPAARDLDTTQYLLLQLFLENFAGDATTPLYKQFVDTKTRIMETGATGVFSYVSNEQGYPVYIGLSDVAPGHIDTQDISAIRQKLQLELDRIASWKDGSPPLLAFNASLKTRLLANQRELSKFVNSPPGFGFRNADSAWMEQLRLLEREPTFRKSILMKPETAAIRKLLSGRTNFWRAYLAGCRLTGVTPYAVGVKPDAALVAQEEAARRSRIAAEVARLQALYRTSGDQETLRRYRADYDAATAQLDAIASQSPPLRFIDTPPLTLDDPLIYQRTRLPGNVPLVTSTFDNMTSAMTSIALRLDGVSDQKMVYLSLLPTLLSDVGIVQNGKPLSYEDTLERQRREILSLSSSFDINPTTKRYELVVSGAGNSAAEAERAVAWIKLLLTAPNWRPENLPRIRDAVDQELQALRNTPQGAEEYWVSGVSQACYHQRDPLALATVSFLTRAHNAQRLRWMLKAVESDGDRRAFFAYLDRLAGAAKQTSRADLKALLSALIGDAGHTGDVTAALQPERDAFGSLPSGAKALAVDAARDLDQTLEEIPDSSLAADWAYLCAEMRRDMMQGPEATLQQLNALRRSLLTTGGARLVVVGSTETQSRLRRPIADLLQALDSVAVPAVAHSDLPLISSRLRDRLPDATKPVFVGLLVPSLQGGVVMNSAPGPSYRDTGTEPLLRLLAFNLYSGGGAESIFSKTWSAGLAYSNGIGANLSSGRFSYYAERTPELPQTVRFVIDTVKSAPRNPNLIEYAIADVFYSRAAEGYEARALAMASDLADNQTPDLVKSFRRRLLDLRHRSDLTDAVYSRLPAVLGTVLPGYGVRCSDVPNGNYVIIGSEKQFTAYETYLKSVEGAQTSLYRLYPRDFWMPMSTSELDSAGGGTGNR